MKSILCHAAPLAVHFKLFYSKCVKIVFKGQDSANEDEHSPLPAIHCCKILFC